MRTGEKLDTTLPDVAAHLERVLASEAFRASRRSQEFLRFVVTRTLDGREDSIKERNIAIEVFDRPAGYNSSEDSFVRVKASEVRRRLAAYYTAPSAEDRLRIELPLGSYVPHFVPLVEQPVPAAPPRTRRVARWLLPAAAAVTILIALWAATRSHSSALDQFWSPIANAAEPLLIYLPLPTSYQIVGERAALRTREPTPKVLYPDGRQAFLAQAPHKVGVGAAIGAIRFAALCARTGKPYTIKTGADFSFADLRNQPVILFGAFSSQWSVEMNNEYRFKLIPGPGNNIVDSANPARQYNVTPGKYPGSPVEDYALASRIIDSKSGRTVILAAGISTYGTQAAAEFLTDPNRLSELAARSPRPLNQGSFQILLHTRIIGNTPTPARIIEAHFW